MAAGSVLRQARRALRFDRDRDTTIRVSEKERRGGERGEGEGRD